MIFLFMAGGAQPSGAVRLQAAAGQVRRHAAAARAAARAIARRSSIPNSKLLGPSSSSPSTAQSGAEISELLPHLAGVADDIAIVKSMVTDAFNHAPGPDPHEHRLAAVRPAQHGRLGDLRPGQRVAGPARRSSSSAPATRARAAATRTGAAASCPRSTRAFRSAAAATRCCISPTRPGSTRRLQRDSLDAISRLNKMRLRRDRRPRDRHADQLVRDGVPDADRVRPS